MLSSDWSSDVCSSDLVEATARGGAQDSFSDTTWKVGANWAVTDWLRFRGTWGTSFRAPALFELFLQDQTGFLGQSDIDPCIQRAARLAARTDERRGGQESVRTVRSRGSRDH